MMQGFAGKTAPVTGSNSGTGKLAAQQLAGRGAHVIPSGRDKARRAGPTAETPLAEVTEVRNVIVIGSGPSGYTAALYAARAELRPLVFDGHGGRRADADHRPHEQCTNNSSQVKGM